MTDPVADPAGAAIPGKVVNIVTFVFDSTLPREAFLRLVQTNEGLVPKLIRRLMEKHGSGDGVRLAGLTVSRMMGADRVASTWVDSHLEPSHSTVRRSRYSGYPIRVHLAHRFPDLTFQARQTLLRQGIGGPAQAFMAVVRRRERCPGQAFLRNGKAAKTA